MTRLITHILVVAGRHVGTTTSDGVLVDERMIDAGDWTGPGGAHLVLGRSDIDVAVLETARGGIVLRGMGYESNDAAVLTNVSSDHLDLQGIHTLPELAEVKATVARITRPDGWSCSTGMTRWSPRCSPGPGARSRTSAWPGPRAQRWSVATSPTVGCAYLVRDGWLCEIEGTTRRRIVGGRPSTDHDRRPGPAQRGERPGGSRWRSRPGRDDRAGARRTGGLPPVR